VSRALAAAERIPLDAYYTPDALAVALVGLLPIEPTDTVLEPHAGGGAFVRALLPRCSGVMACDINPDAEGLRIASASWDLDFLSMRQPSSARWIVGNPPFRGFEAHVDHALTLSRHVAFLMRLAVTESAGRVPMWQRWPLRKVWVLAERPSFTDGGTDSAAYGWFWFDTHHDGPAEIVPGWSWKGERRVLLADELGRGA
jgi:hypothetical protein